MSTEYSGMDLKYSARDNFEQNHFNADHVWVLVKNDSGLKSLGLESASMDVNQLYFKKMLKLYLDQTFWRL